MKVEREEEGTRVYGRRKTEDEQTDEVRMKFGSTLKEEDVDVWFIID